MWVVCVLRVCVCVCVCMFPVCMCFVSINNYPYLSVSVFSQLAVPRHKLQAVDFLVRAAVFSQSWFACPARSVSRLWCVWWSCSCFGGVGLWSVFGGAGQSATGREAQLSPPCRKDTLRYKYLIKESLCKFYKITLQSIFFLCVLCLCVCVCVRVRVRVRVRWSTMFTDVEKWERQEINEAKMYTGGIMSVSVNTKVWYLYQMLRVWSIS